MEGQGLPWPKPAYLKRLAGQERSRVMVLRILEEKLGIREPGEMVMATSEQIIAVVSEVKWCVFSGGRDPCYVDAQIVVVSQAKNPVWLESG